MRRSPEGPKRQGKLRYAMSAQSDGTPFSSNKKQSSSQKSCAKVTNEVFSALTSNEYESGSLFMDSGPYCRIYYSSSHVTSRSRYLRQDTQFLMAWNRNYDITSGLSVNKGRLMQYSVCLHLRHPRNPAPKALFNSNNNK